LTRSADAPIATAPAKSAASASPWRCDAIFSYGPARQRVARARLRCSGREPQRTLRSDIRLLECSPYARDFGFG
jgi:hypothetical protein